MGSTSQLGRILDLVLRPGKDLPEHALARCEFAQQFDVMAFQLRAAFRLQALPVVALRDADIAVVRQFGVLIRHLQEDPVSELL